LKKAYETVYLLKWLFPPGRALEAQTQPNYSNFSNQFNISTEDVTMTLEDNYWQKFDPIDSMD
jgi:hypothetical protein